MILTAESGWTAGEWGYGEEKKAQLRAAVDEYRKEEGLEPVDWESESAEDSEQPPERHVSYPRDAEPVRTAGRRASSEPNPSDGEAGRGAQLSGRNSEHHSRPAKQPSEDRPGRG
jgi:hypothetical protein